MEVFKGINPNCSETVYRISKEDFKRIPEDVLEWGSTEPIGGYSQMLPTEDTECVYYYQASGDKLYSWLEANKIQYDIQDFTGIDEENFINIEPTEEENRQDSGGGSGEFHRRIPYREN